MGPSTAIASGRMIPAFSVATDCSQPGAKFGVVAAHPRDDGDPAIDDVGGVVAPEQADLDHGDVDRSLGEPTEARRRSPARTSVGRTGSSSSTAASPLSTSARSTSEIGSPSRQMRSLMRSRWGLVNVPTVSPWAPSRAVTIAATEPLPFVPVMWITGTSCCGSPSSATSCSIDASDRPSTLPAAMPAVPAS